MPRAGLIGVDKLSMTEVNREFDKAFKTPLKPSVRNNFCVWFGTKHTRYEIER